MWLEARNSGLDFPRSEVGIWEWKRDWGQRPRRETAVQGARSASWATSQPGIRGWSQEEIVTGTREPAHSASGPGGLASVSWSHHHSFLLPGHTLPLPLYVAIATDASWRSLTVPSVPHGSAQSFQSSEAEVHGRDTDDAQVLGLLALPSREHLGWCALATPKEQAALATAHVLLGLCCRQVTPPPRGRIPSLEKVRTHVVWTSLSLMIWCFRTPAEDALLSGKEI